MSTVLAIHSKLGILPLSSTLGIPNTSLLLEVYAFKSNKYVSAIGGICLKSAC